MVNTGDVYYVNHADKTTTWLRPVTATAESSISSPTKEKSPARESKSSPATYSLVGMQDGR